MTQSLWCLFHRVTVVSHVPHAIVLMYWTKLINVEAASEASNDVEFRTGDVLPTKAQAYLLIFLASYHPTILLNASVSNLFDVLQL